MKRDPPEEYAPRILRGWNPRKGGVSLAQEPFPTIDAAFAACNQREGVALTWTESISHSPEGHSFFEGRYAAGKDIKWYIYPDYFERTRIKIEDAEFVSSDEECMLYVRKFITKWSGQIWGVYVQLDFERGNPDRMKWLYERHMKIPFCQVHPLSSILISFEQSEIEAKRVARHIQALDLLMDSSLPSRYTGVNRKFKELLLRLVQRK